MSETAIVAALGGVVAVLAGVVVKLALEIRGLYREMLQWQDEHARRFEQAVRKAADAAAEVTRLLQQEDER